MNPRGAIVALLGLAGCADLPGMAPHSRPLNSATINAGAALRADAGDAWPEASWWRAYCDPQLDALVARALAGNPDLRIAAARIERARGLAAVARGVTLPQLGVEARFARTYETREELSPAPSQAHSYWDDSILAGVRYDLDLWSQHRHALETAIDSVHVEEAESRAAQLALTAAVVQSYVRLAAQFALRDVGSANLTRQTAVLDIARRRHEAEIGPQLEVDQASAVIPETEAQIERLDEAIGLERHRLAALAGQGPGEGETIARPALVLDRPARVPDRLPAELLGHRPDIVAQRWRVLAAGGEIEVAKARFYPDVNLTALVGVVSLGFDRLLARDATMGVVGPAISLPIFTGGRLRGNLTARMADYDIAVEAYNGAVLNAMRDVADRLVTLRSLDRQLALTDASLGFAQTAYQHAELGYRAGVTDYLTVLNAQAQLLVEQRNRAQTISSQLGAHAALMTALGGGYAADPPPEPPGNRDSP